MEWRIRKSSHGGFVAEKGIPHEGGERIPGILEYTTPLLSCMNQRILTRKSRHGLI